MPVPCTVYYVTSCLYQIYACGCGHPGDWGPQLGAYLYVAGGGHPADWGPQMGAILRARGGGHPADLVGLPGPSPATERGGGHPADLVGSGPPSPAIVRGGGHPTDTVQAGTLPLACSGCSSPPSPTLNMSVSVTGPSGPLVGTWTLTPVASTWQATSGNIHLSAGCSAGQLILIVSCLVGGNTGIIPPTSVDCASDMASYTISIPSGFGCSITSGTYTALLTWNV